MPSAESADLDQLEDEAVGSNPDHLALDADERGRVERIVSGLEDRHGLVDQPPTPLVSSVRADALRSGAGVEFAVDEAAMERESEMIRGIFRDPEFIRQMNQVGIDASDDDEADGDDCENIFERKLRTMTDALPDDPERAGLLFKRVRKFGSGGRPPASALVTFHYSLYKELGAGDCYPEPFDSTRQHFEAKPYNKRLGGDLIPGIDWALSTMCKGERAQFMIQPAAFLGEKGAMERVPGGVPILADIELLNFCDSASVDAFYSRDEEERRKVPFKVQLGVVQSLRRAASDLCRRRMWMPALHKYGSAEQVLTTIVLHSDEEEARMQRELVVLCVNKAIALYNLGKFPSVVRECNEALKRDPSNAKALLWKGEAQCSMDQHMEAAASLTACQRLVVGQNSRSRVQEAILRNNDSKKLYDEDQRRLYSRMGAMFADPAGKRPAAAAAPAASANSAAASPQQLELEQAMLLRLREFADDPDRRVLNMPKISLTQAELRCLRAAAERVGGLRVKETIALFTVTKDPQVFE